MVPRLPRAAWGFLAGDALSAIGAGMTLPFLVVYLHAVRGLSLVLAGIALGAHIQELFFLALVGACARAAVAATRLGSYLPAWSNVIEAA
jgi:Na+/melibiose symporter-like transporter